LRVDYPSEEDREHGRRDGRERLGSNIMIHAGRGSVGCLAISDPAPEEVCRVADRVGLANLDALILPHDLRQNPQFPTDVATWIQERYRFMTDKFRSRPVR
jgi:hypothetical protein